MLKLIFADIKKFEDHIYKKSTCVYIQQNIEVHIQYMDKASVKFILDNRCGILGKKSAGNSKELLV